METNYKKITLDTLPSDTFEGYYWMSDATKPVIVKDTKITASLFTKLPFIVEGNFYSKAGKISIQVKNIDGVYDIALTDLKDGDFETTVYIGHDTDGLDFEVANGITEEADELLGGLTTRINTWTVFRGFVKTKKD